MSVKRTTCEICNLNYTINNSQCPFCRREQAKLLRNAIISAAVIVKNGTGHNTIEWLQVQGIDFND